MYVACKIPQGLNVGGIILRGNRLLPGETYETHPLYGGFSITGPVDSAQFSRWLEHNRESPLVINQMVIWAETEEECKAACRAARSVRSGLESSGGQSVR